MKTTLKFQKMADLRVLQVVTYLIQYCLFCHTWSLACHGPDCVAPAGGLLMAEPRLCVHAYEGPLHSDAYALCYMTLS